MTQIKERKYWFKAKRYGYGWYPASWQGWTSTVFYLTALIFVISGSEKDPELTGDYKFVIEQIVSLTALLIVLCYMTGEKARWRWGKEK